ncbi:MAG: DUF1844 domain-containing protein [Acidobacteriota bacterium]
MSEEERVKVTDRRSFTADGDAREDAPRAEAEESAGTAAQPVEADRSPLSFYDIIFSFYQQALASLGLLRAHGEPGSEGSPPPVSLEAAQYMVDVLGVLQEKTKNNLTADEDRFLANVLFELRMAYVHVLKSAARANE